MLKFDDYHSQREFGLAGVEAAKKQTDPELKAKLWQDYRRYKRGTS